MALITSEILPLARIANAPFGPNPFTDISWRNKFFSSIVLKPYKSNISSLTCRYVYKVISSLGWN